MGHRHQTAMKSPILKRSVIISDHKTSVSLEAEFWTALKEVAKIRGVTLSGLVSDIDKARTTENLSSALRLFVLAHYQNSAS
jgi:predicted DNA-binding ribbon-helix-helix protein